MTVFTNANANSSRHFWALLLLGGALVVWALARREGLACRTAADLAEVVELVLGSN